MNKPFSVEILLLMTEQQHLSEFRSLLLAGYPCWWCWLFIMGRDNLVTPEPCHDGRCLCLSVWPIPHNLGHMLTPSKLQMVRGRVKLYLHSEKLIYFINTTTNCPHFLLWQDKQEIFYTADAKSCANQFLYHILFTGSENIKGWNVMV